MQTTFEIFSGTRAVGTPGGAYGKLCGGAWVDSRAATAFGVEIVDSGICHCSPGTQYQPPASLLVEGCYPCPANTYSLGGFTHDVSFSSCSPCRDLGEEFYCEGNGERVFCPEEVGMACFEGDRIFARGVYYTHGESTIQECDLGHFCPGDLQRYPCEPGSYNEKKAASSCLSCPPGHVSNGSGATRCAVCPESTYASNDNTCQPCTMGSYCVSGQKFACPDASKISDGVTCFEGGLVLAHGLYVDENSTLQDCTPGYFCPGNLVRMPCEPNMFSNARATYCMPCPNGRDAVDDRTSCLGSTSSGNSVPMWIYGAVVALVLICLGIGVLLISHRRSRHRATNHRLEYDTYLKKEPVELEHDSKNSRIVFEDYIPSEFLIKRDRLTLEQTLGGGAAGVVKAGRIGNSVRVAVKEVHLRLGIRTFLFLNN